MCIKIICFLLPSCCFVIRNILPWLITTQPLTIRAPALADTLADNQTYQNCHQVIYQTVGRSRHRECSQVAWSAERAEAGPRSKWWNASCEQLDAQTSRVPESQLRCRSALRRAPSTMNSEIVQHCLIYSRNNFEMPSRQTIDRTSASRVFMQENSLTASCSRGWSLLKQFMKH